QLKRYQITDGCSDFEHTETIQGQKGAWYGVHFEGKSGWAFSGYLQELGAFADATRKTVAFPIRNTSKIHIESLASQHVCDIESPNHGAVVTPIAISDHDDYVALLSGTSAGSLGLMFVEIA